MKLRKNSVYLTHEAELDNDIVFPAGACYL